MITEIDTNLLEYPLDGFIHQANCFHTMGVGIAAQIRQKYPEMYEADCAHGPRGEPSRLGKFSVVKCRDDKYGYNLYGQFDCGGWKRNTNYEAVYAGLERIREHAIEANVQRLGLPKFMGCKLGGGDWTIVRSMIDVLFSDSPIDLFICNYGN